MCVCVCVHRIMMFFNHLFNPTNKIPVDLHTLEGFSGGVLSGGQIGRPLTPPNREREQTTSELPMGGISFLTFGLEESEAHTI